MSDFKLGQTVRHKKTHEVAEVADVQPGMDQKITVVYVNTERVARVDPAEFEAAPALKTGS